MTEMKFERIEALESQMGDREAEKQRRTFVF